MSISQGQRRIEAVPTTFFQDLRRILGQNIREYGMFIALFVIMIFFTVTTDGIFISSRNISNLINQTGYIAVLAVGMTLVIVIRHIDLSVGFLSGFLGALAAIALANPTVVSGGLNLPVYLVIPGVLILGTLAGLLTAFMVAQLGIPAFVATLAGMLGYRGALQLVTAGTGTIIISDEFFNALSNGFVPDLFPAGAGPLPGLHKLTLILGLAAIGLLIASQIRERQKKQAYGFEVLPLNIFVLQVAFIALLVAGIMWIMAGYNGMSWTVVIVVAVVAIYHFVTTQMVLGRHIYAIGGNPEAAQLSGISVKRITYLVFGSMGLLSALSGILYASRFKSATTTAGTLFELDAIAAAFIGGVSPAGGIGKVIGSIVGALVMGSLSSGMNLMGIDNSLQYIVKAAVLAGAVIFDVATRNRGR
jgi:putative multiple sugar transport system permease protein